MLFGCTNGSEPRRFLEGENDSGPLSVTLSSGGNSSYAPPDTPWRATFGAAILCLTTDDEVTLRDVRYDAKVKPLSLETILRRVPIATKRTRPSPNSSDWSPISSARGTPEHMEGRTQRAPGTLSRKIEGQVVSNSCDGRSDPSRPYVELMAVMKVDHRGAWLEGFTVEYSIGPEEFEIHSDWQWVACGVSVVASELCSTPPSSPE